MYGDRVLASGRPSGIGYLAARNLPTRRLAAVEMERRAPTLTPRSLPRNNTGPARPPRRVAPSRGGKPASWNRSKHADSFRFRYRVRAAGALRCNLHALYSSIGRARAAQAGRADGRAGDPRSHLLGFLRQPVRPRERGGRPPPLHQRLPAGRYRTAGYRRAGGAAALGGGAAGRHPAIPSREPLLRGGQVQRNRVGAVRRRARGLGARTGDLRLGPQSRPLRLYADAPQ